MLQTVRLLLCYWAVGLWGLILMFVSVLVVVLFRVRATVCSFVAVAFAEAGSVLKCFAVSISVACACACAVSCLQLLLIAGLQVFLNLGLQLSSISSSITLAISGLQSVLVWSLEHVAVLSFLLL
jgi:hypothetical protein